MGGSKAQLDLGKLLTKRIRLIGSTLRGLPLPEKREAVERFRKHAFLLFEDERLRPVIDRVYPSHEVREAHERMEKNLNIGKILLSWK